MVYTHYHHYYIGTFGIVSPNYDNRRMDLQAPRVKTKHDVRIFFPCRGRDRDMMIIVVIFYINLWVPIALSIWSIEGEIKNKDERSTNRTSQSIPWSIMDWLLSSMLPLSVVYQSLHTPRMFSSDELVQKKHYNNRVESELAHDVEEYTDKDLVSTKSKVARRGCTTSEPSNLARHLLHHAYHVAGSVVKCKLLLFFNSVHI